MLAVNIINKNPLIEELTDEGIRIIFGQTEEQINIKHVILREFSSVFANYYDEYQVPMEIEVLSQEQLDATHLLFRSMYVPETTLEDDLLLGWFLQMYRYFDMHFLTITSNVTKTKLKERMEDVGHNAQYLLDDIIFMRTRIACGNYHSLALTEDGRVFGWGRNYQLRVNIPNNLPRIVDISAGQYHSLALSEEGRVFAWGSNNSRQLDVPEELKA